MPPKGSELPAPPGMDLFPVERVLLLAVTFPPMTAAQRRTAAAFAVEERIAVPLDDVQVALVAPLSPAVRGEGQTWLLAVMAHDVIAGLPQPTARQRPLIPDVLCVPRPGPGEWSVVAETGRLLVRLADGTGFAIRPEAFALAHRLAGLPEVVLVAGDPAALGQTAFRQGVLSGGTDPALSGFDLRALVSRPVRLPVPRLSRIAAAVAVAGAGHVAIAGADVVALSAVLRTEQDALSQVLALAGLPGTTSPADVLVARDAAAAEGQGGPPVLPMVAAAAEALTGLPGGIGLREMRFAGGDERTLLLVVQGADLAALQVAGESLARRGLAVEAGPAVNDGGLAEQTLTLREAPP